MARLADKVAIIAGAASGMGYATAPLLAAEVAHVAVTDLNDALGRQAVKEIEAAGGTARYWHLDVSNEAQVA